MRPCTVKTAPAHLHTIHVDRWQPHCGQRQVFRTGSSSANFAVRQPTDAVVSIIKSAKDERIDFANLQLKPVVAESLLRDNRQQNTEYVF